MASRWTLLKLCQEFAGRRGLPIPTVALASTNETDRQMVSLLNEGIYELAELFDWQALNVRQTFTHADLAGYVALNLNGGLETSSSLTSTFKYFRFDTLWDTTNRRPVYGPMNDSDWNSMIAMDIAPAVYNYKVGQGGLQIYPVPNPLPSVTFSVQGVLGQAIHAYDATTQAFTYYSDVFTSDSDVTLFDGKLVLADLRWRWNKEKGMPFATELAAFNSLVSTMMAREGGAPDLHLDGQGPFEQIAKPGLLIAAGNWPVSNP